MGDMADLDIDSMERSEVFMFNTKTGTIERHMGMDIMYAKSDNLKFISDMDREECSRIFYKMDIEELRYFIKIYFEQKE